MSRTRSLFHHFQMEYFIVLVIIIVIKDDLLITPAHQVGRKEKEHCDTSEIQDHVLSVKAPAYNGSRRIYSQRSRSDAATSASEWIKVAMVYIRGTRKQSRHHAEAWICGMQTHWSGAGLKS